MRKQGHYLFIVLPLLFICFTFYTSSAQINQPVRFEEEQKHSDYNFSIISLQQEGLILIRETGKFDDGKKIWEITHLDSALKKTWSDKLKLDNQLNLVGYEYASGHLYLLFRSGEAGSNDLILQDFTLATHQYNEFEIKHQFEFRLTHFSVTGSTAIFGGYAMKEPAVLLFSMAEKQLKVVPGFLLHDTELLDLRVNQNNTFNVLMAERGVREGKKVLVRTYDETGSLLLEDAMSMTQDKTPLTGITSTLLKDEMIIVGTYGIGNSKMASGFYAVMVDPYSDRAFHYTELSQFKHFLDYLGEKKANKVKQKAERQRQRGKTSAFKNSVSLIRIHETTKGFLLLCEVYHSSTGLNSSPYWNTNPYNYGYGRPMYGGYGYSPYGYNPYGSRYYNNSPYPTGSTSNAEAKMIESALILFDDQANFDWDESLKFNNLKYQSVEQASDFVETPKGVLIAYKKENDIYTKLSVPHDDHSLMDTTNLKLLSESDVIKDESAQEGAVKHWYKNNFYTWGYQTIKDKSKQSDPTRYVFYVNKISTE